MRLQSNAAVASLLNSPIFGAASVRRSVRPDCIMPETSFSRESRLWARFWIVQTYAVILMAPICTDGVTVGTLGFSFCFAVLFTYALTRGVYHDAHVLAERMIALLRRIRL
jgi:hypothetical protein